MGKQNDEERNAFIISILCSTTTYIHKRFVYLQQKLITTLSLSLTLLKRTK